MIINLIRYDGVAKATESAHVFSGARVITCFMLTYMALLEKPNANGSLVNYSINYS